MYANQSQAKVVWNYKARFFETETMRYFVPSLIFSYSGNLTWEQKQLKLFETPAPTLHYVTDRDSNLPYPLWTTVSENKEMKDLELVKDIIEKVKEQLEDEEDKNLVDKYFNPIGTPTTSMDDPIIYQTIKETTGSSPSTPPSTPPALTTVNGLCGSANKIYEHTDTTYWTGTFCESGTSNPVTPVFPTEWTPTTWTCEWSGTPTWIPANCSASKTATPVNGACGTANAKIYQYTDASYGSDTFCASWNSTPTDPEFPDPDGSTTWVCEWLNGGTTSSTCSASRAPTPVNGVCGTANNKTYLHTATAFGSDTFCSSGSPDPTTPIFPTAGTSREWVCVWYYGGSEANCSATRSSPPTSVTQTQCQNAGWAWISEANDVYIWNTRWNWFCISPTIDIWDWTGQWIAWNGWGSVSSNASYNGWSFDTYISDSDIPDSYGWQTRNLVNVVYNDHVYNCTAIWSATVWFRNASGQDDQNWQDTLENRMRYLSTYRTNSTKLSAINWISSNAKPAWHLVYPALYLSDCIDGTRDLWNDMTYTHSDNSTQNITYAQYSTQQSSTTWDGRSTEVYQNRQKYLLWWTQKKGSHLPSAYSYITSGTTWWTTWNYKWEYQVACDLNQNIAWTNDQSLWERLWLASIAPTDGIGWGYYARIVGGSGCASQVSAKAGYRNNTMSARFVVR